MPRPRDLAARGGDAHLETVGDAAGTDDEGLGYVALEDFTRGCLEQREPAVEMLRLQRQHQVRAHRAAVVASGLEHHRRPEIGDLADVMVPVLHRRVEDRPDQVIRAGAAVEGRDQPCDFLFGEIRMEGVNGGRGFDHGPDVSCRPAAGNGAKPLPP